MAGSFVNFGALALKRGGARGTSRPEALAAPWKIYVETRGVDHAPRPTTSIPTGSDGLPHSPMTKPPLGLSARALAAIARHIDAHMDESIGVSALADLANLSRSHFSRMFKRSMGLTPMAYVERSRVQRARGLIMEGRLSLAEIALECGFADQSHFTRRFHRQAGCTPAAFAREHCARRLPRQPR
jgi:transcriptional regulator GlxA family with amidase domain